MATKEQLIAAYIHRREEIKRIEEEMIAPLKKQMGDIETLLAGKMDAEGENSCNTDAGTAYFKTNDYASVSDPSAFFDFVVAEKAWDLLERRAAKTAVRAFIEDRKELPPGINYGQKREVYINRPSKKEK